VRKNASDVTVDQVLAWVTAVLVVGVFNWLWWAVADDRFRELFGRLIESPMTPLGLR
jgi:hypothetical protein